MQGLAVWDLAVVGDILVYVVSGQAQRAPLSSAEMLTGHDC
jgi:hypothetical protein